MRNNYVRLVAVAVAIISAGLVGACGGGTPDNKVALSDVSAGAVKDFASGTTFKATVPLTFTILYSDHPNYPVKADWLLWQKMTELTNVTLDRTIVPLSDYLQKRSLLVGAGDAPMIIPKTYPGQESRTCRPGRSCQ